MNKINLILIIVLSIVILSTSIIIKLYSQNKQNISFPFYISTKNNEANLRSGPSKDYPIVLSYNAKNFPLKVIQKHNEWYQVVDYLNNQGWIYINLTSKKHSAITINNSTILYSIANVDSKQIAIIKNNYIVNISHCDNSFFCKITLKYEDTTISGWIEKKDLWGID